MPTSARCWDFGRPSVGADDPGGPNPRLPRLPCVKGAVARRATEGLSGVAGPFGGDLCLALLSARALFHANSRWFLNTSPPRVGADLCVRPDTPLRGIRHGPTHRLAPTDPIATSINPKTTGGDRAPPLPADRGPQRNTRPLRQCRRGLVPSCRREGGTGRSLAPMFLGTLGRIVFTAV